LKNQSVKKVQVNRLSVHERLFVQPVLAALWNSFGYSGWHLYVSLSSISV